MHLQDFAKEEEPRIAAVVALQGAQKIQWSCFSSYLTLLVFTYKIIDDSILLFARGLAWNLNWSELMGAASWRSCNISCHSNRLSGTASCWYWANWRTWLSCQVSDIWGEYTSQTFSICVLYKSSGFIDFNILKKQIRWTCPIVRDQLVSRHRRICSCRSHTGGFQVFQGLSGDSAVEILTLRSLAAWLLDSCLMDMAVVVFTLAAGACQRIMLSFTAKDLTLAKPEKWNKRCSMSWSDLKWSKEMLLLSDDANMLI